VSPDTLLFSLILFATKNTEHQVKESTSLCGKFWDQDRPKFMQLWSTSGVLYPIRNDIVRKYSDIDILSVDQNYE